jgi:hypothetical protein
VSSFISLLSLVTVGPISPIIPFILSVAIIILIFSLIEFNCGPHLFGEALEIGIGVFVEEFNFELLLLTDNFFELEAITHVNIKLNAIVVSCLIVNDY